MFRAYVDPSASVATELFGKLGRFFGTPTAVSGVGGEAYFDQRHGLHVRKSKVRFYINLEPMDFTPVVEKQLKDLASRVTERL